jgi:hypothetical protein
MQFSLENFRARWALWLPSYNDGIASLYKFVWRGCAGVIVARA